MAVGNEPRHPSGQKVEWAVIVLIIGLHFVLLAWLFQVWPYYVAGTVMSLVAVSTLI
jgi:hypothetical protein